MKRFLIIAVIIIFSLLFIYALLKEEPSKTKKYSTSLSDPVATLSKGPPQGYNGAGVDLGAVRLYIYKMSKSDYDWGIISFGRKYSYMKLGINNEMGLNTYTWHCQLNKIKIILKNGTEVRSFDISDADGFYKQREWIKDEYSCVIKALPGEVKRKSLAFYPSFSWENVVEVYIGDRNKWHKCRWTMED